jgi:Cupin-like domain
MFPDLVPRPHRRRFAVLFFLEWLLGPRLTRQVCRNSRQHFEQKLEVALARTKHVGTTYALPRRRHLSVAAFTREYVEKDRPVVLEGAASAWPAIRKWTPAYFAEVCRNDVIPFVDGKHWTVSRSGEYAVDADFGHMSVSELINSINEGSGKYLRFYPILAHHPEVLADLDADFIFRYARISPRWRRQVLVKLFFGGGGTSTEMHHAIISNLFVQVFGMKRWHLYPPWYSPLMYPVAKRNSFFVGKVDYRNPDLSSTPLFQYADGFVTILSPGDVLYVPPLWWHGVSNVTTSIALSYWWLSLPRLLGSRGAFPQSLLSFFGRPNPALIALGLEDAENDPVYLVNRVSNARSASC